MKRLKMRLAIVPVLILTFANLNQLIRGQSLLSLDLHKQSQRTKQDQLPSGKFLAEIKKRDIYSSDTKQMAKNGPITNSDALTTRIANEEFRSQLEDVDESTAARNRLTSSTPTSVHQDDAPITRTSDRTTTTTTRQPQTTTSSVAQSEANSESSAAELCYLSNGGSSLTLTVNEATQVGTAIGTIDVS